MRPLMRTESSKCAMGVLFEGDCLALRVDFVPQGRIVSQRALVLNRIVSIMKNRLAVTKDR
jgi:hypothetical protein